MKYNKNIENWENVMYITNTFHNQRALYCIIVRQWTCTERMCSRVVIINSYSNLALWIDKKYKMYFWIEKIKGLIKA